MNCKIKSLGLGLALVAALALAATMASVASAQFTSNKEHTILSGSQKAGSNDVFTAGEGFGGITCASATFEGTAANKSEFEQLITPTYQSCKDSFGRTVDIDNGETFWNGHFYLWTNWLRYTFTSGASKGKAVVDGRMVLTVTSGGSVICTIEITYPWVWQTITGITYTNLGGTNGVEVTAHAKNVISTTSGGFFNCGIGNGEHKAGTYDGTAVLTGKDTSGAAAEISVD